MKTELKTELKGFQTEVTATKTEAGRNLGRLFWYTIPEAVKMRREDLEAIFDGIGIPKEFLPPRIREVDAFRRATSEVEVKGAPTDEQGIFYNLLVREVTAKKDRVIRRLVEELVDGKSLRLHYREVAEFALSRENGAMTTFTLSAARNSSMVYDLLEKVGRLYEEYRENYVSRHLRELLFEMLSRSHPTAVRPSGGVYFVPEEESQWLAKVGEFLKAIGAEFFSVPLVETLDGRRMLLDKVSENTMARVRAFKDGLERPTVTAGELARFRDEAEYLLESLKVYGRLLEHPFAAEEAAVKAVKDRLSEAIKEKAPGRRVVVV